MTKEMRKRLEEAAERAMPEVVRGNPFYIPSYHCGFAKGAELGYKEAIAQATEWIGDLCEKIGFSNKTISQCVESFETNMNKLWEGEK